MLFNGFLVFLGGGLGSLLRYLVNFVTQIYTFNQFGTFFVKTKEVLLSNELKSFKKKYS